MIYGGELVVKTGNSGSSRSGTHHEDRSELLQRGVQECTAAIHEWFSDGVGGNDFILSFSQSRSERANTNDANFISIGKTRKRTRSSGVLLEKRKKRKRTRAPKVLSNKRVW